MYSEKSTLGVNARRVSPLSGANSLSGVAAHELSGLMGTEGVPHDQDTNAAGDPAIQIQESVRGVAGTAAVARGGGAAVGVCECTFRRYLGRYEAEGLDGLADKRVSRVSARRVRRGPGMHRQGTRRSRHHHDARGEPLSRRARPRGGQRGAGGSMPWDRPSFDRGLAATRRPALRPRTCMGKLRAHERLQPVERVKRFPGGERVGVDSVERLQYLRIARRRR